MARVKVVDVSIQVTCREDEAGQVTAELNNWFCNSEVSLVQRPRTGGVQVSKSRPMRPWMRETLDPSSC
jgi:hypothetical protein